MKGWYVKDELKGLGRKRSWPNFKVLPRNVSGGTEENHEKPQDSRSPVRGLNPGPPEYEARVSTILPLNSVISLFSSLDKYIIIIIIM
jgi:hypothetical protein